MAIWTYTAEGGINGASITTSDAGNGSTFDTISTSGTGSSITYSTAQAMHGTKSLYVSGGASGQCYTRWNNLNSQTFSLRYYVRFGTSTTSATMFKVANSTATALSINTLGNSRLQFADASATTVAFYSTGLSAGTWYRVEAQFDLGTSSTTGQLNAQLYTADGTTAVWTSGTLTGLNLGGAIASWAGFGDTGTGNICDYYLDDMAISTGTTSPLGPAQTPPTATFTYSLTGLSATFDGTASVANAFGASITGYAWTFGDGGTSTSSTPTHVYSTTGNYTVTLTVTDSNSQTSSASQSVAAGTYGTFHRNGMEGQTNGSAATAVNSSVSGSPWTLVSVGGGSATYTNVRSASGTLSLQITSDGSSAAFFDDSSFNSTSMAVSDCFYYPSLPNGASAPVYSLRTAAGVAAAVWITTGGFLQVLDAASGAALTAGSALVPGHWYRIETQVFSDASAGTIALQYYRDNTGSAIESLSVSNRNTRGGNMTYVRRGCSASTYSTTLPYWNFDNVQTWDGTTAPIGAYANNIPPKAAFTDSVTQATASFNGSSSSAFSPATISTYSWNYGDSSSGSGSNVSHTYTSSGTYTASLTVTDSNGLHNTTSLSFSVTVPSSLPEMYVYHNSAWVGSALYVYHSGQWVLVG